LAVPPDAPTVSFVEASGRETIMASTAIAPTAASTRTERYLETERRLWQHYRLQPDEQFIDLDTPAARLRVLEAGLGEPLLFVHGTVGRVGGHH
jgi:hypothetical protein